MAKNCVVAPNSPVRKGSEKNKKTPPPGVSQPAINGAKQLLGEKGEQTMVERGVSQPAIIGAKQPNNKNPSKGKGEVLDPTYCGPLRAWPRPRSGEPSKYPRMGDAVALVSPRIKGGLIRPLGFGEGFSALRNQTPKILKTWARGVITPSPVRNEGNLDTTTPKRIQTKKKLPAQTTNYKGQQHVVV